MEPPDQGLCVGNGFVLESINITIQPFDDAGSPLEPPVDQNAFYQLPRDSTRLRACPVRS